MTYGYRFKLSGCKVSGCGSYAFNLDKGGIDQGDLCDVHYWENEYNVLKADYDALHKAWKAKDVDQQPVAIVNRGMGDIEWLENSDLYADDTPLYSASLHTWTSVRKVLEESTVKECLTADYELYAAKAEIMRIELAEICAALDDPRTDLTATMPELVRELKAVARRYEHVRRLNVPEFKKLFVENLTSGIPFDTLVDNAIKGGE